MSMLIGQNIIFVKISKIDSSFGFRSFFLTWIPLFVLATKIKNYTYLNTLNGSLKTSFTIAVKNRMGKNVKTKRNESKQ